MSRFSEIATLITKTYTLDDDLQQIPVEDTRQVFVNPFAIGADDFFAAAQAGLKPDCELQMRTDEYNDETYLDFRGKRLKVVRVREDGEYTRLTCERVVADV